MDEAELSRAFPIGDGACLEAVIARYGQALLRYCHHILCDYHEAQDAVQDALLRAALSVLTLEERGLVFGRVMEGRSYEELSQIYGPSAAALRKRYERARKKLALALSESELDEQKEVVP